MHRAGKRRQARGSEHIGLCRARVTVAERLGDNGAPGVTVKEPHAAGPAKAMRADPGGIDPGLCQDGPGQAGELVGWEFGGEIRVDGEWLELPSSVDGKQVHWEPSFVQPCGETLDLVGPGGEGGGSGRTGLEGLEPGADDRKDARVEGGEARQARAYALQEASTPRNGVVRAGNCRWLAREAPVGLGAEHGDVDHIGEPQEIPELALEHVVIAQRAVVQEGHMPDRRVAGPPAAIREGAAGPWPPPARRGAGGADDGDLMREDGRGSPPAGGAPPGAEGATPVPDDERVGVGRV
jgi:hypothetical protein